MSERTVTITERNGTYHVQNHGIAEFALIGILECLIFDLKSAARQSAGTGHRESLAGQNKVNDHQPAAPDDSTRRREETETAEEAQEAQEVEMIADSKAAAPEPKREAAQSATAPDLRTRINNAVKAIRGLGAQLEDTDLTDLTEEELRSELEELTNQYKRLKISKGAQKQGK